ncbi:MAG: toluene monooxygenase system protein [Actinomycetota bacterium]|jgi:toluene monooxygenase system protein D|nr:toluene monooxygenase system protein [Actinomycetota bacterium]
MSAQHVKLVGPLIRGVDADLADAVISAVEADNPDAEVVVEDQGGYIRINVADRCRLTRASMQEALGQATFDLSRLEPALSGFAGRMHTTDEEIVWYLERQD